MKLSLNEKKASLGILAVLIFIITALIIIGNRNLWFVSKNKYITHISDADGLRVGSIVTLSGLRVGTVRKLTVNDDNKIEVTFSIKKDLSHKIRHDSVARIIRAFIIGEKRVDIIPGTKASELVPNLGIIKGLDSMEITDLLAGKNISGILLKTDDLLSAISKLGKTMNIFFDKTNPEELTKSYKLINPTLKNLNTLAKDLHILTKHVNKDFLNNGLAHDALAKVNKIITPISKREKLLNQMMENLNNLSMELAKNPDFAKQGIDTLKEISITLKAMQKTWFLSDHVERK